MHGLTDCQGIKIEAKAVTTALPGKSQRKKKEKYTNASLPFPSAHSNTFMSRWHKRFKPAIIAWGATSGDPFGTNANLTEVVTTLWPAVFPEIKDKVQDEVDLAAIIAVVSVFANL